MASGNPCWGAGARDWTGQIVSDAALCVGQVGKKGPFADFEDLGFEA